jgi:hypothetical protein
MRHARRITVKECEKRYSVEEAAEVSSLSSKTVRRAVEEALETGGGRGLWPLERVGRRVLIPASALEGWLRSFRLGDREAA